MTQTITGLYESYPAAEAAVTDLEAAGIPAANISLIANDLERRPGQEGESAALEDAGKGVSIGAVVGGAGGLLAGLGVLIVPGIGPVMAAGWLATTVIGAIGGAVVGGAAGGLVGALTHAGFSEEHANVYAEGVRRGGALVTARIEEGHVAAAKGILDAHHPIDPEVRGAAWRAAGWQGFDPAAPAYTADEVAGERRTFAEDRFRGDTMTGEDTTMTEEERLGSLTHRQTPPA